MPRLDDPNKHIAPDGGWGWVVVASAGLNNMICIPIRNGFALLFRRVFEQLEMTGTDISLIININSAFGMLLGLINGPLIKSYGFRKVAMFSSLLSFIGLALTSFATNFGEFIIFYGLINSLGFVMTMVSFNIATNTYFQKRRSRASGIVATATGLGPVIIPLVISGLVNYYGVRGACLILSAITLHSFCGALLLQPVRRHYKDTQNPEVPEELKIIKDEGFSSVYKYDVEDMEQKAFLRRVSGTLTEERRNSVHSIHSLTNEEAQPTKKKDNTEMKYMSTSHIDLEIARGNIDIAEKTEAEGTKWYHKITTMFDLDLLKDPILCNIVIGLALSQCAEMNFALLTPLILGSKGFDINETAQIMSISSIADVTLRSVSPYIGDFFKISARKMFILSLVFAFITRIAITLVETYSATLIVYILFSISRAIRTVYRLVVIPNYVPLEKLPSSLSFQTVLNGIFLLLGGPILGIMRDTFGDYNICIHVINMFTLTTITLWTIEYIITLRNDH